MIDWTAAQLPTQVERLANGLTVVAHAESRSPVVAVYLGYRAGSRDEPKTKAGLAHLCEHLMFSGTKAFPGSYFAPFEQAGAAWMNAYVKEDYSAYFATVPVGALEFALRMEADRMAHLTEALDEEKVERQREVAINELRQREGEPYGYATRYLAELAHPRGHPYAHPPDGLIEELNNISIGDVRGWIVSRHVAAGAAVVIAGDVEPGKAVEMARHYFEPIARMPPTPRPPPAVPRAPAAGRRRIEQPVKHGKIYVAWIGPAFASRDYPACHTACEILAGGKSSTLGIRVIQAERLASEVAFELHPRELGSLIVLSITAHSGIPLDAIEAIMRSEVARLAADGPSQQELDIARLRLFGKLVRGFERVGGRQSKSDALGLAMLVGGTPELHERHLSEIAAMEPETVGAAVRRWLSADGAALEIQPAA
jgi:predicted Zn-dependent peptidase